MELRLNGKCLGNPAINHPTACFVRVLSTPDLEKLVFSI